MIMEGGSEQRDNVEWMIKYNKPQIQPVIKKYGLNVIGTFPSITIIKKCVTIVLADQHPLQNLL